jgi:hypothetical protein
VRRWSGVLALSAGALLVLSDCKKQGPLVDADAGEQDAGSSAPSELRLFARALRDAAPDAGVAVDAGTTDAGRVDAGPVDAGPGNAGQGDGGDDGLASAEEDPAPASSDEPLELRPGEQPVMDPTSALELTTNRIVRNYRLRVLDEADRVMASDDVPEELPQGIRYTLRFLTGLRPGSSYAIVLDAQSGATMTDDAGAPLPPLRVGLEISGEKEKAPPPPVERSKKKR